MHMVGVKDGKNKTNIVIITVSTVIGVAVLLASLLCYSHFRRKTEPGLYDKPVC